MKNSSTVSSPQQKHLMSERSKSALASAGSVSADVAVGTAGKFTSTVSDFAAEGGGGGRDEEAEATTTSEDLSLK